MKPPSAPHTNQFAAGRDFETDDPIELAARDQRNHANLEAQKLSGGDPLKHAELMFRQARINARSAELINSAGVVVLGQGGLGKETP